MKSIFWGFFIANACKFVCFWHVYNIKNKIFVNRFNILVYGFIFIFSNYFSEKT